MYHKDVKSFLLKLTTERNIIMAYKELTDAV